MHKLLTFLLFFAFTTLSYCQNITLKGKITDAQDIPLESATVYLTSVKDSTMIDYTITGKNGSWEIKTRKITQPVFLKISFIGMSDYKQQLDSATEDKDFGTVKLEDKPSELNEVVIESEIPPIRIKSDTLEFNAASFKVRPDANVEALLKQLPGVDIDEEGKITVNGKEVNQILVNGKPFFDRDGKVALQNLPADIINKVQVTESKSKQEELSGQKASTDNASINLTIDEEKNKGYFGKLMGGYGSDDRYESSLLANYFKGPTKISLLASSNNINSSGFSMDEIFDTMGGGRNSSFWSSDDGSFSVNGMQFGGGRGITQSNILGLNYADEWAKGFDGNGSYFYSSADTDNQNRSSETNFLPVDATTGDLTDPSYRVDSRSKTNTSRYAHNFNTEFDIKIDSTTSIYFAPKFVTANSKYRNTSSQESYRIADGRPMNESVNNNFTNNDNKGFESYFVFNKAFKKKGRSMNVILQNDNKVDDGTEYNAYDINTYKYENGEQTVKNRNRDQLRLNRQANDNYTVGIEYLEPVTDSMNVKIGMIYENKRMLQDRDGFDLDPLTNRYSVYNDSLTNYMASKTNTLKPVAGFSISKGKLWFNFEAGPQISRFDNYSLYRGANTKLVKDYVLPAANMNMNYQISKSSSVYLYYNYDVTFPQPNMILPVDDVSNPLAITRGNSDLDPQRYHSVNLGFRDFDYATRSGYNFWAGGNFNHDEIKGFTEVNTSGERTTQYTNVSGTFYTWFGGNYNKSIKTEGGNTYRFSLGLNGGFNVDKGFLNDVLFDSKSVRLTPRINFTYEYGELLTISPSYNFTYRQTNFSDNYPVGEASNAVHRINLQTTSRWPKHVVFGNDFGYTYTTQIANGFKPDFFLWNSSLGYNFLQDHLLFKVKVYDMLNQNIGTTRNITPTSIRDEENTVLRRYVMFSLTFKLDKFAKKKEEGGSPFWWF